MRRSIFVLAALLGLSGAAAGAGLQTVFGSGGLAKIVYNGATLMDATSNAGNGFTIWEYRLIAPNGSVQGGWGENNNTRTWDPSTSTLTWAYSWGKVKASYVQSGDTLTMSITVSNTDPSMTVEGLNIYPFVMTFPQMPAGFIDLNYPQIQFNTNGPGVTGADYGSGMVVMANEDASKPLYTGFSSTGSLNYHVLIGSTYNSGQATFWPKLTRPVPPGGTDTYRVSFRFAPSGTPINSVAGDVYNNYRTTWPYMVNWPDRRPVGAIFLSTSGTGNDHYKAGFPSNPRRYFNDPTVNIATPSGLASFQQRVLAAAAYDAANIQSIGGQGMITWDIEGQEYPQETSYVCDPEKLAQLAPEMESILPDGTKLIDSYFKKFKDAGLKIGVCVRPQAFTVYPDGTADQVYLDATLTNNQQIVNTVAANLIHKIGYAKNRWGVSIIYVDSAVNTNRGPLDAAVFRAVLQAYPDLLIIPEEHTAGHEAYTAGWKQPGARPSEVRTTDDYKLVYPQAFSMVYVADAPVGPDGNLAQYDQYVQGVKGGDMLLFRAFFQDTYYNGQVVKIYASAGVRSAPVAPAIISFSASPASVSAGASTTLSWSVTGATSVSISPGPGIVAGSSVAVTPGATTTYTLTASNAAGTVQASTTVTVSVPPPVPAPVIVSFSATPASVSAGGSTVLSWNVTGATSLSISPGPGIVAGSSISVTPSATTTYTLTASNATGTVQANTTVTVAGAVPVPAPVIVSFSANPALVTAGASTVLSWSVTGATLLSISPSPGTVTGSSVTVTPSGTTTYTLTAANAGGTVQAGATVSVTVVNPVPLAGTQFVTSATPHILRNNYPGWVGMRFTVGAASLSISALGRYAAPANTGVHTVKLVRASDGVDVPGGATAVPMAGSIPNQFKYASLAAPITLSAGATYYLMTQEFVGGDGWYDWDQISVTADSTANGAVYGDGSGRWNTWTNGPYAFGPVSFAYTTQPVAIAPPVASTSFVTSVAPRLLRSNYTGWVGMSITTGPLGLNVTGLGRYSVPGNSRAHVLKLVRASDSTDVPGGSVVIAMAGTAAGQFAVGTFLAPIYLPPNTTYHVLSQELVGGDQWYDQDSISTTSDGRVEGSEYGDGSGLWQRAGNGIESFGPVTFTYTVPSAQNAQK